MDMRSIGLFDSGAGGLTILREVRRLLPSESLIYCADTAYFPYGARSPEALRERSALVVRRLIALECKLIVVACNTATVAALAHLRQTFPLVPFVGVVPVVKLLAERTRSGTIALLSTPGTAASPYTAELIGRFAAERRVINVGCEGLADLIEGGTVDGPLLRGALERHLAPVLESDADVLGLGCTHYPLVRAEIERLLGSRVSVYDSAEPVARRVRTLLDREAAGAPLRSPGPSRFFATREPERFAALAARLLDDPTLRVDALEATPVPSA